MLDNVIDLSHFNTVSNFHEILESGICAVIHKATQGSDFTDPDYTARCTAAKNSGLLWGAYHFADGSDVTTQVEHFLAVATDTRLLIPDVEPNRAGSTMSLAQAEEFVTQIFNRTGRWPGIYCGYYLKELLAGVSATPLTNCWLWYAEYDVEQPIIPKQWAQWTMWQYTDCGSISGSTLSCDRDRFNGSLEDLARLFQRGEI